MRKFIVDRIEDGRAVLETENSEPLEVDESQLPEGVKAGDVLKNEGDTLVKAPEETQKRRETVRNLLKELIEEKNR